MTTKTAFKSYVLSAVFGALGGLITIGMIALLDLTNDFIWKHGFGMDTSAPTRTLAVLPIMLGVGLIVGLIVKRYGKIDGLDGVMKDVLTKGSINWKRVPLAVLTSLLSIGSGASLGPEAPSVVVSVGVASLAADKLKANQDASRVMGVAGLSGMLGGMLGAPFLTPAMLIEIIDKKLSELSQLLICSMIASAFGVASFIIVLGKLFTIDVGLPTYGGSNIQALLWAFAFGVAGALAAILIFLVSKVAVKPLLARFKNPVIKAMFAGLVMAAVAIAFPMTMFSGQSTMPHLIEQAANLSIIALLVIGIVKLLATNILIDSGFFGGGIFPALFAGAAFGLALDKLVGVSPAIAVPATIAGLFTVAQGKPLTAALMTVAITGSITGPSVAVAVAGASLVGLAVKSKLQPA